MDSKKKELKRDIVTADVLKWERNRQRLEKTVGKKKANAQEALYSVCSSQCRAKPALLADVSSSTLSSPPASPPFLRLLSSCYPPPLSCMVHSCSATHMKTGPETQSGTSFCRIEVIWSE